MARKRPLASHPGRRILWVHEPRASNFHVHAAMTLTGVIGSTFQRNDRIYPLPVREPTSIQRVAYDALLAAFLHDAMVTDDAGHPIRAPSLDSVRGSLVNSEFMKRETWDARLLGALLEGRRHTNRAPLHRLVDLPLEYCAAVEWEIIGDGPVDALFAGPDRFPIYQELERSHAASEAKPAILRYGPTEGDDFFPTREKLAYVALDTSAPERIKRDLYTHSHNWKRILAATPDPNIVLTIGEEVSDWGGKARNFVLSCIREALTIGTEVGKGLNLPHLLAAVEELEGLLGIVGSERLAQDFLDELHNSPDVRGIDFVRTAEQNLRLVYEAVIDTRLTPVKGSQIMPWRARPVVPHDVSVDRRVGAILAKLLQQRRGRGGALKHVEVVAALAAKGFSRKTDGQYEFPLMKVSEIWQAIGREPSPSHRERMRQVLVDLRAVGIIERQGNRVRLLATEFLFRVGPAFYRGGSSRSTVTTKDSTAETDRAT